MTVLADESLLVEAAQRFALPEDLIALMRHAYAVASTGRIVLGQLTDAKPRQVGWLNPRRLVLQVFPVTGTIYYGFSDTVSASQSDPNAGIPVPSMGGNIYGSNYIGPVWIVGTGTFPLDVRVAEYDEMDPDAFLKLVKKQGA